MSTGVVETRPTREERQAAHRRRLRDYLGDLTGRGVRVGVIDSGWDSGIGDDRVGPGVGVEWSDDPTGAVITPDSDDRNGHGTACTSLLLRQAPGAEVVPIRVFGSRLETSPEVLCAAVLWAIGRRIDVLNLSLGTVDTRHAPLLRAACERACAAGIIVVAARSGSMLWSAPASFATTIGVAPGHFDHALNFTFRTNDVEIRAKSAHDGVLGLGGARRAVSASSFATPCVSGLVALLLERFPTAGIDDLRRLLASCAFDETTREGGCVRPALDPRGEDADVGP